MMDWQPIETAPKDGTAVLVYGKTEKSFSGAPYMGVREFRREWWIEPNISAYDLDDDLRGDSSYNELTHWMPLPPAPEPTK